MIEDLAERKSKARRYWIAANYYVAIVIAPLRHSAIVATVAPVPALSDRYDVRMFHKFIAIAAWALLAFIAFATISPIRPTLPISSSFERLAAFAVLGALFCLAYPRLSLS